MTRKELLAKFIRDIEAWTFDVFDLRSEVDSITRRRITKWIKELRPLYYGGMLSMNTKATEGKLSMLGVAAKAFEEEFKKKVIALSKTDFAKATILERSLVRKFGKDRWKKFYSDYDQLAQNYSGKSLRETQKLFLKKTKTLRFEDKSGRAWQPKNYASMYARTRQAEVSNAITLAEMENLGMNFVQVTNANTTTPICTLHEDKFYSLDGKGLPKLPYYAPFHPNCRHDIVPRSNRGLEKYKAHNAKMDRRINQKKSGWTDADWRAIKRQEIWLKANQPV
jgi:hypothetical protein